LKLSRKAQRDLDGIWDESFDQWGVTQADSYISQIRHSLSLIDEHPNLGVGIDWLRLGYRRHVIGVHATYYRLSPKHRFEVVRILHQHMDPELYL
jgi:toxin ParE1/3/4